MKLFCRVAFIAFAAGAHLWAQAPANIPDDTVVVKIDGKPITAGEIRKAVQLMPPDFSRMYEQNPKMAVQQLYMMRHLAAEAEKAKLPEQSPLKEQLELTRSNILASAFVSSEHNNFVPTQAMLQDYYNANLARFQQAKVKVISITYKPQNMGAATGAPGSMEDIARGAAEAAMSNVQRPETEARKRAEEVTAKLRAGGDFAALSAEYTDDPKFKSSGGDFGMVSVESPHPDGLKKMIFGLKVGEVSEPLRQPAAYYVFVVEDKKAQRLEDVSEPVVQAVKQQHVNEWMQTVSQRFDPVVENQQFFAPAPRFALPAPLAPKTPNQNPASK